MRRGSRLPRLLQQYSEQTGEGNQPRWLSVGGWEKKVWHVYIMGYYSFIKGMKDFHCGKKGPKDIKELI